MSDDLPPSQRPTQEVMISHVVKPSDVLAVLHVEQLPFTNIFGRTEREAAVYYITLVCSRKHDVYEPIGFEDIRGTFIEDDDNVWLTNPFFRPDFDDLVVHGFASWVSDDPRQIALTPLGIGKLREFLKRSP